MPCDKDFGYMRVSQRLTYNLWMLWWSKTWYPRLTCLTVSKTTPKVHLIILGQFLMGNEAHTTSSSIWVRVNCSRVWVNCLQASIKWHLSCTIYAHHNINFDLISMQSTQWTRKNFRNLMILKNFQWTLFIIHLRLLFYFVFRTRSICFRNIYRLQMALGV